MINCCTSMGNYCLSHIYPVCYAFHKTAMDGARG